jgi:hypothetical protein
LKTREQGTSGNKTGNDEKAQAGNSSIGGNLEDLTK